MKRPWLFLLSIAAAAAAAFALCYHYAMQPVRTVELSPNAELAWLRTEFHLDDAQFTRVAALHDQYDPICIENCAHIEENNTLIRQLLTTRNAATPEIEAAIRRSGELHRACRETMLHHIYAVAAVLRPDQAARYRALMADRIVQPALPHAPRHGE